MTRTVRTARGAGPSRLRILFLLLATGIAGAGALSVPGCAVNPVTGEREFVLVSESQEIQMGAAADPDIVASLGIYDDPELQRYVAELGTRMARASERPSLPWTFRVLDDPTVNAFALPGGYIYVTRGILAHFSSEAELAGVLGHEIGHVTARHGVSQMSRAQLAQLGLGIGSILSEDFAQVADLAGAGLGLLFLSYGRDAERQADDLGLRYMTREGYDPSEMAATFGMLAAASGAADGERIPGFLSTHPDPLSRRDRILDAVRTGAVTGTRVERESYLQRVEGIVFGANPREGYFEGDAFLHPELAFRFDVPSGWQRVNQKSAVQALSPEQDALVVLTIAEAPSASAALQTFAASEGLTAGNARSETRNGLPQARADFVAQTQDGPLRGSVTFVEHGGRVYRLLGYAVEARWSARAGAVLGTLESFRNVTDPAVLNRQPDRMRLVRTDREMTLQEFHTRFPSTVSLETVATINHLDPGTRIPGGTLLKRVVAGTP